MSSLSCGIAHPPFLRRYLAAHLTDILEHRKENKLSAKHLVEEAMSAALIQKCNRCSKPFVKISGCNKMTCSCGNLQCYVCGKSIKDYHHFGRAEGPNGTKCPLHEKDDSRLEKKLRDAREEAVKKVLDDQADVEEEDIRVPVELNVKDYPAGRKVEQPHQFDGLPPQMVAGQGMMRNVPPNYQHIYGLNPPQLVHVNVDVQVSSYTATLISSNMDQILCRTFTTIYPLTFIVHQGNQDLQ